MFKRHPISYAPGYPNTDKVAAKRLGGLFLRDRDRTVVVVNGTSCFTVPMGRFQSLKVGPCDSGSGQGVWGLIGRTHQGAEEVAARFGSEPTANAAFAAVVKASTGIGGGAGGWRFGLGAVAIAFFMVTLVSVIAGASVPTGVPVAGAKSEQRLAATGGSGEPSLEELERLASSGYEFKPKLSVPQVEAPALACASQ